jgi:hypothetical protein
MKAIRQEQVIQQGVAKPILEIDLRGSANRGSFCRGVFAADEGMRRTGGRGA